MFDFRLIRYATVGLANTCVGLLAIFGSKGLLGMSDVASNLLGYAIGITFSFALNRRWTFEDKGSIAPALARYACVLLVAYALNLATVLFAISILDLNSYLAQVSGIIPYFIVGYVGSRLFAFSAPGKTHVPTPTA